jgi:pimeloyl-ACP methyl ester carboxylesterase
MNKTAFTFPVGYHPFHVEQLYNFQLNRWYSLGYARFEDMVEAGKRIRTFNEWKPVMLQLAEKAVSENRLMNAAFLYRAAEFYTLPKDPDKESLYDRFIELFYRVFQNDGVERITIPYLDTFLPAIKVPASSNKKGIIVIHGGFDSFIEEFYSWMRYFSDNGYEVLAFEGPGQGAALKKYGLPLTYEWEKPVKAVLDNCKLEDVTLIGISMGGYLCFRAAAYEPRIARVIASGIAFDYMQMPPLPLQWLMWVFLQFEGLMNYAAKEKMKKMPDHQWSVNNLMYITRTDTPMAAMRTVLQMNEKNLHSDLVKQDVLILSGTDDHFIPLKMHYKQVKALINARSVTGRIFIREEQAHNHCQIGNIGLALETMVKWIGEKS